MAARDEYIELLDRQLAPNSLKERDKLILLVAGVATDLDMGGVTGFLYNISPDASSDQRRWVRLRETIEALNLVKARGAVRAFRSLLPKLEKSVKDDGTWGGFLEARSIQPDELYDVLETSEDLFRLLDAHLSPHQTPKVQCKSKRKSAPASGKRAKPKSKKSVEPTPKASVRRASTSAKKDQKRAKSSKRK